MEAEATSFAELREQLIAAKGDRAKQDELLDRWNALRDIAITASLEHEFEDL
jgi:hypothetical protein